MATAYLSPGVYVEEVDRGSKPIEGVGTAVAAFIGFAESGPVGQPTLVTNWSQFQRTFGRFVKGSYLAPSIYGYFNNGGGIAYVTRLPGDMEPSTNGTNGAHRSPVLAALPSRGNQALASLEISALDPGTPANEITIEVRAPDEGNSDDHFTLAVKHGDTEEVFPNVTLGRGRNARNVVDVVNRESKLVKVAEKEVAGTLLERAPQVGSYQLARPEVSSLAPVASALPPVSTREFIGDAAARTGIMGLEVTDNVTMVAVPDLMAAYQAGQISGDGVRAVQTALMNHCEAMKDRVAIIDCPPELSPQEIRDWRMNIAGYDSKYAALYYPWIQVADPSGETDGLMIPPSGHMAGIWARNDSERGVHKAPANEIVRGAISLGVQISRNEQDTLNPIGINCIRAFPAAGSGCGVREPCRAIRRGGT